MPRSYRHIKEYETEILSLKEQGLTLREIGEKYGFSYEQIHNFISRHNERQRKIAAGIALYKGKTETLAAYYVRVHGHLLGDVSVFEISDAGVIRVIREGTAEQPI